MLSKKQTDAALAKIQECKKWGCSTEALLRYYQLNVSILRLLQLKLSNTGNQSAKPKEVLLDLLEVVKTSANAKAIITRKNLKPVKPWAENMGAYFRLLKTGKIPPPAKLLGESEKIFGILNISLTKVFLKHNK